jgi:DUF4097 and DUF4098 domain-containing protein YvlB
MNRRSIVRRAAVLAPVLSLLAILSGCTVSGSVVAFDEERQTFQVDAAPVVVVETFNGRISVTSASAGVVEARVTRRGSGTSQEAAERDLANVRVDFELVGNRVTITARRVNQQTLGNSGADVEVLVPADSSVELRTSNGRVESANVSGSVIVRTSNGAVTTRGGSELDLDTTNGQISVNNPGGRLGIRTSNGSIDISSAKDVAVTAQTSNAPITFSGTLAPGQHAFATSNEDIAITLPGDTGFAFDGQTSNGLVRTEFTELTVTDTSITGSTGTDPQISIVARTSNGDLTVSTQRP